MAAPMVSAQTAALFAALVAAGAALGGILIGILLREGRDLQDAVVLQQLAQAGESYGLALVNAGAGHRGTIYVRLHRLEEEGLLTSHQEAGGPERGYRPRRLYSLTEAGRAALLVANTRAKYAEAARRAA